MIDPQLCDLWMAEKRRELFQDAERERLAAQLPRQRSAARRELALTCRRLASWLEDPERYIRTPESRQTDLVGRSAGL